MISAVYVVIGAWLLCIFSLAGLGYLIRERFGLPLRGAGSDCFWMGYAVVIGVLQLWQLIFPIDWKVTALLGVVGLYGYLRAIRAEWRKAIRPGTIAQGVVILLVLSPLAFWVAGRALYWQLDFDSGFYHLSAIRWLNSYPTVPGIGNLHYRLAFNQTFFLFCAALNLAPYSNLGFHIANSLLLMVLAAALVSRTMDAGHALIRQPKTIGPYLVASALFLPALVYHVIYQRTSGNISSPSPDLSVFILQAVVGLAFIRFLFEPEAIENEQRFRVLFLLTLSAVGVTSKLSFAAFGVTIVLLTISVVMLRQRQAIWRALRPIIISFLLVTILLGLPWLVRGIITSGYPAFPSAFGALSVDFRVPSAIRREAELWVYSFARNPRGSMDAVLSNWDWIPGWWTRLTDPVDIYLFVLPLQITAVSLALTLGLRLLITLGRLLRRRPLGNQWVRWLLPLLPLGVAGGFWFVSAPDPRFAGSVFWLLAVWSVSLVIFTVATEPPRWMILPILLIAVGLTVAIVVEGYQEGVTIDGATFPRVPVASIQVYTTDSGLAVNISGDPANSLQLWDAPLPASPYRLPGLALRGDNLRDGFRLPLDATLTPP